jgi:molybdopterin converting factor small subunit
MNLIDSRWGTQMPAQLWDSEAKRFRGPVTVMMGGNDVHDEGTPLSEQDEVFVLLPLAGGSDIGLPIDKV